MDRPAPPKWDLNRNLDQPEDEFFGLIEDDFDVGAQPSPSAPQQRKPGRIGQLLENITDKLVERGESKENEQELHELQESQPPGGVPSGSPDLTAHLSRLSTAQDKLRESFLAAENATSLFDEIQQTQRKRVRVTSWSLWISALIFIWLGVQGGKSYLQGLYSNNLPSETWLVGLIGGHYAHALGVITGMVSPLALFALTVMSFDYILGGIVERRVPRIFLGLASGLTGLWTATALLSAQAYTSALIILTVALIASRLVEKVLMRLGWY